MLYEKLRAYAAGGAYPMHMPGHKRNTALLPSGLPYDIDVSEINGFDNLSDPKGVLRETAEIAAALYGSDKAFLLVNGATVGILAAIGAHTGSGDRILMARNCHLSVYNAVALFGLEPIYIVPETDKAAGISCSVDPASVESALASNDSIKLVAVTSPTYEGVVSDIGSIAAVAHKLGVPLVVDEAHGAHLGFSGMFPDSAVHTGADVSVMSLHKTFPALTQSALLHVCGRRADMDGISRMLTVLQTSSPSYVLMASIDYCLRLLLSGKDRLFREYERNLDQFGREAEALKNLWVLCKGGDAPHPDFFDFDPGKIVAITKNTALSGLMLTEILRTEYKIELEMACAGYAAAMTGVCDTADGFARLSRALAAIDKSLISTENSSVAEIRKPPLPLQAETPGGALKRRGSFIPLEKSEGYMSLEYVSLYPPGIPIITPGEIISEETVEYINWLVRAGFAPKSTRGMLPESIYVFGT